MENIRIYGFVRDRSTIDATHALKQIMAKAQEYCMKLEMFQQTFDSVKRNVFMAMREVGEDLAKIGVVNWRKKTEFRKVRRGMVRKIGIEE